MSLFDDYRVIDAAGIVRANIEYGYIEDDLRALIDALTPLTHLVRSRMRIGHRLNDDLARRIERAKGLKDVLLKLGYRNERDVYILSDDRNRQDVEREVQYLYEDLLKIQHRGFDRLRSFLRSDDRPTSRPAGSSSSSSSNANSLPTSSNRYGQRINVDEQNNRTLDAIRLLRQKLISPSNSPLASGFIRRRIARHHYRSMNPNATGWDDDQVDHEIDQRMRTMKDNRREQNTSFPDEIYVECLIRTNFDTQKALKMFNDERPVVTPPAQRAEPQRNDIPQIPQVSANALRQHADVLRNPPQTSNTGHDDHKWKNMQHLIFAVKKLRERYPNPAPNSDEDHLRFAKMCRLLTSEISTVGQSAVPVKIETIGRELCAMSADDLNVLDVSTVRSRYEQTTYIGPGGFGSLLVECPLCYDRFPRAQMEVMYFCGHLVCTHCPRGYYSSVIPNIRDEKSLLSLTCPVCQCSMPEDPEERLLFFVVLDEKIRQWFKDQPNIIDLYNENIFYARREKQLKACGNSQCREMLDFGANANVGLVRCPKCNFEQCRLCNQAWKDGHVGKTCREFGVWLINEDPVNPEVLLRGVIEREGVTCPYEDCGHSFIYEAGGCEHYDCPTCKKPFCVNCSSLWVRVPNDQNCPVSANCRVKGLHGHCPPNCFREVRDAELPTFINHLQEHNIDVEYEPANPNVIPTGKCEMQGCTRDAVAESGNRLCGFCYKKYLWKSLWNAEIEPWGLYHDENLAVLLRKAGVPVPEEPSRDQLIEMVEEHLTDNLGRPRRMAPREVPADYLTDED